MSRGWALVYFGPVALLALTGALPLVGIGAIIWFCFLTLFRGVFQF